MTASVENIVAIKLGDAYNSFVEQVDLAIGQTEQTILNYCNLDVVPEGLRYVWADMAIDLIMGNGIPSLGESLAGGVPTPVKSVTMGDMKIDYGSTGAHSINLDTLIMNYKAQLNGYRKMSW